MPASDLKPAPDWFESAYEDVLFRHHGVLSSSGKDAAADLWEKVHAYGYVVAVTSAANPEMVLGRPLVSPDA